MKSLGFNDTDELWNRIDLAGKEQLEFDEFAHKLILLSVAKEPDTDEEDNDRETYQEFNRDASGDLQALRKLKINFNELS